MNWIKKALAEMEEPQDTTSEQKAGSIPHPILELIKFLKDSDPNLVEHTYTQKEDGSKEIKFMLPSRSQLQKQKAMQQAEEQMQNQPAANISQMQQPQQANPALPEQEQQVAAAKSNVQVRIAVSSDKGDAFKKFPAQFVKAMGL